VCAAAFAAALGMVAPAIAEEDAADAPGAGSAEERDRSSTTTAPDARSSAPPHLQMAQFQVPSRPRGESVLRPSERDAILPALPSDLKFGYAWGSDTELVYRKNQDLDNRLGDSFADLAPTLFAFVDYRPTNWLEMRLEGTAEYIWALQRRSSTTLPNGEVVPATVQGSSLLLDQAYATFKNLAGPFDFTVGRRNFEDPRLWLYDAALDGFIVKHRYETLHTEISATKENLVDLDLMKNVPITHQENYILYTEYRGIEDNKIGGYAIKRIDSQTLEGRPFWYGVRAIGRPTDRFNYWADLGFVNGTDELNRPLGAFAFDVGGTYRFPDLPLQPSVTLGFAYGSGDPNPNDNKNREFRQTGLQSNEGRFGGVTQFKYYGEALDPELSNLRIATVGIGFRPAPNAFVDIVYHHYRANAIADQIRNWGLTAQMNQDDTQLSKDVGSEIDLIVGFRNLFGLRRFGLEVRAGWFFPGKAFQNDYTTDPAVPVFRRADKAVSLLLVFIL
jgi:alginate production protein